MKEGEWVHEVSAGLFISVFCFFSIFLTKRICIDNRSAARLNVNDGMLTDNPAPPQPPEPALQNDHVCIVMCPNDETMCGFKN